MKKLLILNALLCLSLFGFAQVKKGSSPTWIDASVKAKSEIRKSQQKAGFPVKSAWMKVNSPAVALSADVTGQEYLVLQTQGGPDGVDWDWAVWANAQLVKKDGTIVWLDELKPEFWRTGTNSIPTNKDYHGNPITIGKKKYDHGVMCHSPGIIIYKIDKDYVKFNTEVGIVDASRVGSAYFTISNQYPKEQAEKLKSTYPDEITAWTSFLSNTEDWLLDVDGGMEKETLLSMASKLKNKSYYESLINDIDKKESNPDAKVRSYLNLFGELNQVSALQGELEWLNITAIRDAFANMKTLQGFDTAKYEPVLKELEGQVSKGFDGIYKGDKEAITRAEKAIANKRTILLANPLLDNGKVIAARYVLGTSARRAMAPELGTQANNWSNQESARRSGFDASIVELSNFNGTPEMRTVYKPSNGSSIADLKLHWGGEKAMFTALMPDKRWNLFEVNLSEGKAKPMMEMLEPDLEFYDGTWLPDGRIIANSNIGYQGVPCVSGSDPVGNMVLYNPENKNMRRLTFDQDANWNPVIMNNGRVMYTRWEYTDLTHYYSRIVMHMNPDGTENKALWGSGNMFPNSTFDIQPLPGKSSAFVGIISGHHGTARSGRLIIFDPNKARKGAAGMTQEIPFRNRPIVEIIRDELVDGVWPQFIKPTPVNDDYFLVAAKLSPDDLWGIYLVDVFDNVTCLQKVEGEGYISPILVHETKTPPSIPDRVKLDDKEATVFIQDIYEGEGLRGVPKGTVKELRIHAYEYAYLKTTSDHNWQGIQSGWDIKRNLGTTKVEEDGSAIFKIPANTPISIQPIDENGAAIQWMRSWFTGQPGEIVSCIGCHEDQNQIPIPKRTIASQKKAEPLKTPEGGVRSFTYDLEVQPVLDRACIACHNGEGKAFDLRGGKKDKLGYGTSYLNLHPYVHRQGPEADIIVLQPYEYHANTSELIRVLKKGHHNVKLTDEEWKTLYNWIDYNAPDRGFFNANQIDGLHKGFNQIERRIELTDKYACGMGVDWKKEISDYADHLKAKGEITPVMPEPLKPVKVKNVKAKGWPFDAAVAKELQSKEGETKKVVEIAPGVKMTFVRIPAGEFVMGSYNGESDALPQSKVKVNKAYWMAEVEVTNEQYNVIYPEHDSRYVDQLWKDHIYAGYPANLPEQPVIRVSYQDAMAYCDALSEKTGVKFTLPTEAQWEWACRAGSENDFWFGDLNADFGKMENLADATTNQFAVSGVDPQPMGEKSFWYKYYTYLPKAESVNDGHMIQTDSKKFDANPFGLHSMHGNIAEWTKSDYLPYPYNEKSKATSEYKVARGGSYIERPKFSTSYARKAYYPWQRVHNVGFRLIIEE